MLRAFIELLMILLFPRSVTCPAGHQAEAASACVRVTVAAEWRARCDADNGLDCTRWTTREVVPVRVWCGEDERAVTAMDSRSISCRRVRVDEHGVAWVIDQKERRR